MLVSQSVHKDGIIEYNFIFVKRYYKLRLLNKYHDYIISQPGDICFAYFNDIYLTRTLTKDILKNNMENKEKNNLKKFAPKQKRGTTLTFSADELSTLARYIAAGMVLLQTKHPVTSRIKGALTRIGLPHPNGL